MTRIIIDTNLLVAYMFNKKSAAAKILALSEKGRVRLMWHRKIMNEAELITGKISKAAPRAAINLKNIFKKNNEIKNMPRIKGASRDPDDDKFLACAVAAHADMIVSNDEHLLEIQSFRGIPIHTSARAIKILSSRA